MNKILLALAILLVVGGTASAQWYAPEVVSAYYPPVYTAPAPYVVQSPVVYSTYYAPPVVVAQPRVAYMPVGPVYAAPAPVVYGPTAVVRSKVYYPGRPVRNTVRYVLP